MKKIFFTCIITLSLLLSFLTLSSYALDAKYETIKIGISYGSSAKSQVSVASIGGFNAGYMNDSTFVGSGFGFAEVNLTVTASGSMVVVNGVAYNTENGNFAIVPLNGQVNIDGTIYRGGVELIPNSNGRLTVINFVNINDYIAGVVGKEMSPSWNIEALKAQAVCARSYAVRTWSKHSSYGFNLCGTQDCQAYLGTSGETESTIRAATETKDQLLMYGGTIAEALYSSSCGGSTAYAKNVWGNDVAYLQAIQDPYDKYTNNPRASWSVTLTKADIKTKLANNSVNIGDITDFKVIGADEYGRTYEVTIYGTAGTHVLKNDKTRSFFDFYSQKYTITPSGVEPVVEEQNNLEALHSGGQTALDVIVAKGSENVKTLVNNFYIKSSIATTLHTPVVTQTAPAVSNADSYIVNGAGWGHGIGLCQYGAKGMADQGYDYVSILKFYYKGTEVK